MRTESITRYARKAAIGSSILLMGVLLVVYLSGMAFARPYMDDYNLAFTAESRGFWGAAIYWYTRWTGRFVSFSLMGGAARLFPLLKYYGFFLALSASTLLGGMVMFVHALSRFRLRETLLISLFLAVLYFSTMPTLQQGLYWWCSSWIYTLSSGCVLAYLAVLHGPATRRWADVLAGALPLIAIGMNEVYAPYFLALLLLLCVPSLRSVSLSTRRVYLGLASTVVGTMLFFLSPGNAAREAIQDPAWAAQAGVIGFALAQGTKWSVQTAYAWLYQPGLLFLALIYVGGRRVVPRSSNDAPRLLSAAAWLTAYGAWLWGTSLIFYYKTGHPPPPRVSNTLYLLWFIHVLKVLTEMTGCAVSKGKPDSDHEGEICLTYRPIWVGLLAVYCLLTWNSTTSIKNLFHAAPQFYKESRVREASLQAARGADEQVVAPLSVLPMHISIADLSADPESGPNAAMARYFGVKKLWADGGGPSPLH